MPQFPLVTEQFPGGSGRTGDGGPVTNTPLPDSVNDKLFFPWAIDPEATWLSYNCDLEVVLDPGSALHKPLPQSYPDWDTLAGIDITSEAFASSTAGINLNSHSRAVDIIQRMASSTYRFILRGQSLRAAYRVNIPGIARIQSAGPVVRAVPTYPQQARHQLAGNLLGGIPLWYATWELHYLLTVSPKATSPAMVPAVPNPAAHIRPDAQLPTVVRAPFLVPDQHSVAGQVQQVQQVPLGGFIVRAP